ncbi:protoglobin domain-containing protein [Methylocystis sp. IM3]|uniref:protoglobin domain-containing protein n=1 Tax=unclassified Methylocystis TaxID=2625913 RepID=UPI000FC1CA04|nr:MAG: STAS domain-containing protein [Hyphomicrobiales bacterium]
MIFQEFRKLYEVTDVDFERVRALSPYLSPLIDSFLGELYDYMRAALGHEFEVHFPDEPSLHRAQAHSRRAWLEFLDAEWDEDYVKSRVRIGEVHAQLQIKPRHYLSVMNKALQLWSDRIYATGLDKEELSKSVESFWRVGQMEGALVVDIYAQMTAEIISQQSRALTDMSTPITAIWDGILMLPVVGIVDSRRAQDIMQRMLEQIAEKRAQVFILDISGVAVVDTAVANHFIRMTKAARLMGSYTIVSGLSPSVAQTIVELGIEVGDMKTTGNLQDALRIAFDRAGVEQKIAGK